MNNFFSKRDSILKYLYKTFELRDNLKSTDNNSKNYDIPDIVNGHFDYKANLSKILKI